MSIARIAASLALALAAAQNPALADSPVPAAADTETTSSLHFDFPKAGELRIVDAPEVERLLKDHGSDLLVVNFWATWCSPCVAELPYFVRISKEYPTRRVRVVGLTVDLKRDAQTKVIPFLRKHEIPFSNLLVFTDQAALIETFSKEWGGDVPATFLYDKEGRKLAEVLDDIEYEKLKDLVEKNLPAKPAE